MTPGRLKRGARGGQKHFERADEIGDPPKKCGVSRSHQDGSRMEKIRKKEGWNRGEWDRKRIGKRERSLITGLILRTVITPGTVKTIPVKHKTSRAKDAWSFF